MPYYYRSIKIYLPSLILSILCDESPAKSKFRLFYDQNNFHIGEELHHFAAQHLLGRVK